MGKGKLKKWNENATFAHVFEPPLQNAIDGVEFMKGDWHKEFFKNDHPITLELGCGKGEYTVELARTYPDRNFIGIDIKGHRFWRGAKTANAENLSNVAFLRTRIEFINCFFAKDEVDEIWLTFSDPQPKDDKGTKRLTSPIFIDRYKQFLKKDGIIHIKTDSPLLYEFSCKALEEAGYSFEANTNDLYGKHIQTVDEEEAHILNIRTYYEKIWMDKGRTINYLRFRV